MEKENCDACDTQKKHTYTLKYEKKKIKLKRRRQVEIIILYTQKNKTSIIGYNHGSCSWIIWYEQ